MPTLNVTFTGSSTQLDATMLAEKAKIKAFSKSVSAETFSKEIAKNQVAKAVSIDEEINRALVNKSAARQAIRKNRTAKEMAEVAAGSGAFGWLGKGKKAAEEIEEVGKAAEGAGKKAHGLGSIIKESMVLVHEFLRGSGGGRIAGSATILAQNFANYWKANLLSIGIWAAAAAVTVGVIYERFWGIKSLIKSLSFDTSKIDIGDSYIPKLERHTANAANEARALADELRHVTDEYESATSAAKRLADISKEQFEHARRMNDLSNVPEYIKQQRSADIDQAERAAAIQAKEREQAELAAEAQRKFAEAQGKFGGLRTKAEDEDAQKKLDERAEAAKKFLDDRGSLMEEIKKHAAEGSGAIAGAMTLTGDPLGIGSIAAANSGANAEGRTTAKLDEAEQRGIDTANRIIKQANDFRDRVAQRDIDRARQKELLAAGNKSAGGATAIGLDLPFMRQQARQRDADAAQELRARMLSGGAVNGELTGNQRIGAYAMPAQTTIIDLTRQSLGKLTSIDKNIGNLQKADMNGAFTG